MKLICGLLGKLKFSTLMHEVKCHGSKYFCSLIFHKILWEQEEKNCFLDDIGFWKKIFYDPKLYEIQIFNFKEYRKRTYSFSSFFSLSSFLSFFLSSFLSFFSFFSFFFSSSSSISSSSSSPSPSSALYSSSSTFFFFLDFFSFAGAFFLFVSFGGGSFPSGFFLNHSLSSFFKTSFFDS